MPWSRVVPRPDTGGAAPVEDEESARAREDYRPRRAAPETGVETAPAERDWAEHYPAEVPTSPAPAQAAASTDTAPASTSWRDLEQPQDPEQALAAATIRYDPYDL